MSARRIGRLLVAVLTLSSPAYAADPGVALSDYVVTSWTMKDGLPSAVIWGIAQDRDGYLWLGTNGGLVRFDGVQFITWDNVGGVPLPKVPVHSLYISRDGTLWAGFSLSETGGISRIREGRLRTYGESDGLAPGTVNALIEDLAGGVWAGTNTGLFRLREDRDRWEAVTPAQGLPAARVDSLYVDEPGNLLVGTAAGVFRKPSQSTTFQQVDSPDPTPPVVRGFSEDRSGRIWVTDPVGGFRILGDRTTRTTRRGRGNTLLHDHTGNLWVTTMGGGIWRVTRLTGAVADTIEKAYTPGAREIFEDRDGQIWAGNGEGLIRFAKPKVTPITDVGLIFGIQATPDGSIWATTPDSVIQFPNTGSVRLFREAMRQPGIRTFRVDERGVLWLATSTRLVRVSGDRRDYPLPAAAALNRINGIASDGHGGLWISDRDRGVFRFTPARPATIEPVRELAGTRMSSMLTDHNGRLWFASTTGRIGVMDAGTVHIYGPDSGLGAGLNSAMYEDSRHVIWVGGNDGLKRFVDGRFVHLNQGARFRTVIGIIEDADGDLWLGTTSGIVLVKRSELEKATAQPGYELFARVFDAADGLAGLPARFENPSQVRDSTGRLWFVTQRGLTAFDPQELKIPHAPVAARIERIVVDEQPIPLTGRVRLPAGAARLAIDYSVLDLATPWRTQFRYRLDGFDRGWIDAGTHREAVYTHLPPGSYTFHVASSQSDGSWNDVAADWTFAVAPRFYQTYWFYALAAAALGLVTWAAWQVRVRRIRRQFALLIGERSRLSREIHDTLLQSLVGVALQFDALGARLDAASPERQQLVRIRKEVEQYIREARHSIWNLRKPVIGRRDLPGEMREAAQRITVGHDIGFDFVVRGTPYACPAEADEQLMRICQEAVLNAVRHAGAASIRVELRYEPDAIVLRVTDDGRGFDPETTIPLEAAGHYGLVSMRERASQVGGVFTVTTSERAGTSIEARVPAGAHA
jgi:signal transduction histidine kinase/ligand-binding sensor domain-containing protein